MIIIKLRVEIGGRGLEAQECISVSPNSSVSLILVIAFLVKFPVYYFHLWLPKAHVEAPVAGSIILAGVLLKLGGYGLFLVSGVLLKNSLIFFMLCTRLMGSGLLAVLILRCSDLKVIIAYSSVVHIRMVIVVLMGNRYLGI